MSGRQLAGRTFAAPELVSGYEDWYATPYGRIADALETEVLLELLKPLGPGARVLELGCGTAHFGAALAARGFRVSGVDPEPAMLAVARSRSPRCLRSRARACRACVGTDCDCRFAIAPSTAS
ncbi:MAG: class I SAM-dependent methyltransferase [Planctomycetes bacterium]|nr:class I SAM-dependent methyltransferase [Planctomycetota bacterium]